MVEPVLAYLTETEYSNGTQSTPPIAILSLISSTLIPKFDPSIVTRVPPSTGPDSG